MKKNVSFMRNIYTSEEKTHIREYLEPLFENDHFLFKKMIQNQQAYIDGKRFTYIKHPEVNKKYRIMGNCIGPILYVRDILNINDPDTLFVDPQDDANKKE